MVSPWRRRRMLLLLMMMMVEAWTDTEPQVSCWSHISTRGSSLTCRNQQHEHHNEIKAMIVCFSEWGSRSRCLQTEGDSLVSEDLNPLLKLNLTVYLRTGQVSSLVDLRTIVKPRPPMVWNVSLDETEVVIHIRTPYLKDYLTEHNQVFQLHCSSSQHHLTVESQSRLWVVVPLRSLIGGGQYEVKVRAAPTGFIKGSWSDWSSKVKLHIPAGVSTAQWWLWVAVVSMVTLVSVVMCRNRLMVWVWPSIPHPKQALVQICHLNWGRQLGAEPEEFSVLRVTPEGKEPPSLRAPPPSCSVCDEQLYCSSPTSSCGSVPPEQAEAYVTMSTFCHNREEEPQEGGASGVPCRGGVTV